MKFTFGIVDITSTKDSTVKIRINNGIHPALEVPLFQLSARHSAVRNIARIYKGGSLNDITHISCCVCD